MKLIRDGKVAVIVSPGYGAGWSTWGAQESCLDGELAQAILDNSKDILAIAKKNWPGQYQGDLMNCRVEWVPEGHRFEVQEYDGYETLHIFSEDDGLLA